MVVVEARKVRNGVWVLILPMGEEDMEVSVYSLQDAKAVVKLFAMAFGVEVGLRLVKDVDVEVDE